jgi:uncharacterized FAD-dependent dehydrogenase
MPRKISNIQVTLDEQLEDKLRVLAPDMTSYRIYKKSLDARRRGQLKEVYTVEVFENNEEPVKEDLTPEKMDYKGDPVVIVGSGPAGLFCALRLIERGIPCHLIERGGPVEQRIVKIAKFWRSGELDTNDNVCFGEGGAGLYSDGKLITRIRSPHIPYVMQKLVQFGAPEEIQYLSNPHVGSDRIRRLLPNMRKYLQANGCKVHFHSSVSELLFEGRQITGVKLKSGKEFHSDKVVLATGHSASDVFLFLRQNGIAVEGKSFAIGLRIEHPQELIDKAQYRQFAGHPKLGAANYSLTHHDPETDIGVYSFCMCPGGYVLSAGTETNGLVCNGMSNYLRNSGFANAAIVVTIDHQKRFRKNDLGGLEFRKELEQKAFRAAQKQTKGPFLPAQRVVDFLEGKIGELVKSSAPSGVVPARLDELLPMSLTEKLREGLEVFDKKIRGFTSEQAQLYGIESRTSCPVRVIRDPESLESVSHRGLYPAGEGAGYAGGITSCAVDGIKIAEKIAEA